MGGGAVGSVASSTTWNPDAVDHTVNPNKSRKTMVTPLPGSIRTREKVTTRKPKTTAPSPLEEEFSNFLEVVTTC